MNPRLSLFLFVMAGLIVAFAPLPVPPTASQERTFRIEARQFAFSPSELTVNTGDSNLRFKEAPYIEVLEAC